MIYGSETWPTRVEDKQRLERTETMIVRHMCDVMLKDKKSMEDLRGRLVIESVSDVIRRGRLRWLDRMERKDSDWVKACQWVEVNSKRGRGRGRKTWTESVWRRIRRHWD
jgi:Arc/MetJ-type ribon-helix-helix transcriptional regulator